MKKLLLVISVLVALAVLVLVVFNPVAGIARTTWLWFLLIPVALIGGSHIYEAVKKYQARKKSMTILEDDEEDDEEEEYEDENATPAVDPRVAELEAEVERLKRAFGHEKLATMLAVADVDDTLEVLDAQVEVRNPKKKVEDEKEAAKAALRKKYNV